MVICKPNLTVIFFYLQLLQENKFNYYANLRKAFLKHFTIILSVIVKSNRKKNLRHRLDMFFCRPGKRGPVLKWYKLPGKQLSNIKHLKYVKIICFKINFMDIQKILKPILFLRTLFNLFSLTHQDFNALKPLPSPLSHYLPSAFYLKLKHIFTYVIVSIKLLKTIKNE